MKTIYLIAILLALPGSLLAQQSTTRCPTLPSASGLQWQERAGNGFIVCKAVTGDGRQSLNMLLTSRDPDIRLSRSQRAEAGTFSGEALHWYVPELAGRDPAFAESRRITVVELRKGQYAQVWIDAESPKELGQLQSLASQLDISAGAAYLVSSGN